MSCFSNRYKRGGRKSGLKDQRLGWPGLGISTGPNCAWAPAGGFTTGQWYHAAGVMDYASQQAMLYVNGVLVDTKPAPVTVNPRVIPMNLSACNACSSASTLDGNMDEVRIWDRPLSAAEIAGNYYQCLAGNEANLFVYYRCNQVGASSVVDATTNGNTGAFLGAPGWSALNAPVTGLICQKYCDDKGADGRDKVAGIQQRAGQDAGLKIYPNPASGNIKVSAKQEGMLSLYAATGELLSEIMVDTRDNDVNLEAYKPGIYFYVFSSGSSRTSGKLVIE